MDGEALGLGVNDDLPPAARPAAPHKRWSSRTRSAAAPCDVAASACTLECPLARNGGGGEGGRACVASPRSISGKPRRRPSAVACRRVRRA